MMVTTRVVPLALFGVLASACDAKDAQDAPEVDAGVLQGDAAPAHARLAEDVGASDGGRAVEPTDPPSASFLLDEGAQPKTLWPGHPRTDCILALAESGARAEVEPVIGTAAFLSLASVRGRGLETLQALDATPLIGPLAFARLEAAVQGRMGCSCEGAACGTDPRLVQRRELVDLIQFLSDNQGNALDLGVDVAELQARVDTILARGAGTEAAFVFALRTIMLAFPNGHAGVFATQSGFPFASASRWGVCARPHARGFIITFAAPSNPLGLSAGDIVLEVDGRSGPELVAWLLPQPSSSAMPASDSAFSHIAGLQLFSTLRFGATLTVEGVDGTRRATSARVSSPPSEPVDCQDPLARDRTQDVYADLRPDDVAVIRLPNLVPSGEPPPQTSDALIAYLQVLVDRISAAAQSVVTGQTRAVVWDIRGNVGGSSPVGFAVVQGFLSTRSGDLSVCEVRQPGTNRFAPAGGDYRIDPGGVVRFDGLVFQVGGAFDFGLPSAVLVDGLSLSAADYFALSAKRQTDAWVIGAPTAGGFGSSNLEQAISGWRVFSDALRCIDANRLPLEGFGVEVDLAVEYTPADLSAGRDTILEAAVAEVLRCGQTDCAPPD